MTFMPRKSKNPTPVAEIEKRQLGFYRQIKKAFDIQKLEVICAASPEYFEQYATRIEGRPSRYRDQASPHWFDDRDSDILAIAHLDSVQKPGTFKVKGNRVYSPVLDDRLGAYVILELLPKIGIFCDILLTTDEEFGASTARDFEPFKDYNWMFEFDREGTSTVMYQYDTPELCDLLEVHGHAPEYGLYSDIADLDHLGCAGFNFGVGYHDYHSKRAYACLDELWMQVARFATFYFDHKGDAFPYLEEEVEWNQTTKNWKDDDFQGPGKGLSDQEIDQWWEDYDRELKSIQPDHAYSEPYKPDATNGDVIDFLKEWGENDVNF